MRPLSLDGRANPSHGRLPGVTALRLLPERWLPLQPDFSRMAGYIAPSMHCSNGIEVTDADPHSQLLLQFSLQLATCNPRGRLTPRLQPVQYGGKHFGGVSMSAILQGGFSSSASLLPPTIGGGPTRLDPCGCCRLLPGHPCFHEF